ncbi:hypothetical protein K788_00022040 (plasmid) [Paraburkholderia caribensis MBA4]|uniref:Uncharacterized protein n=1 Tax=Paraburkholderia caribensis MBA4 TaxID=1323664 RepID=A0A0P0RP46_9BURK|nr:hypothetical protein K788_00022040 [Paraburkholderia caribensis MBA4]
MGRSLPRVYGAWAMAGTFKCVLLGENMGGTT